MMQKLLDYLVAVSIKIALHHVIAFVPPILHPTNIENLIVMVL